MRLLRFSPLLLTATLAGAAPMTAALGDEGAPEGVQTSEAPQDQNGRRQNEGREQGGGQEKSKDEQQERKKQSGEQVPPKSGQVPPKSGNEQPTRGRQAGATREAPKNTLPEAYARFDLNGDGRLGPGERRAAREQLDPKVSAEDLEARKKSGARGFAPKVPANGKNTGARAGDGAAGISPRQTGGRNASGRDGSGSSGTDSVSRLQAARDAVAQERARRRSEVVASRARAQEKAATRDPKKTPLAIYRSLSKYQPKASTTKQAGKGWAPTRRQGVTRGKKRGSAYYREQIARSGRGGRGGRGGRNRNRNLPRY